MKPTDILVIVSLIIAGIMAIITDYFFNNPTSINMATFSISFLANYILLKSLFTKTLHSDIWFLASSDLKEILIDQPEKKKVLYWKRQHPNAKEVIRDLGKQSITVQFNPVTKNNQVINIKCQITLYSPTDPEKILAIERDPLEKYMWAISHQITYFLHELKMDPKQEMTKFYNPLNEEQQKEFAKFIKNFLLENGVKFYDYTPAIRFDIS